MVHRILSLTLAALLITAVAGAHVRVRARESEAGAVKRADGRAVATIAGSSAQGASAADVAAVEQWIAGYDAAFLSKDLERIAAFYHPDVTIYEGAGINNGWVDYRDKHLGPELKAFEGLEFGHSDRKVTMSPDGRSAYVTSRYFIKAKMGERTLDSVGLETLVVMKQPDGAWKIRHSHTSGRARRPNEK